MPLGSWDIAPFDSSPQLRVNWKLPTAAFPQVYKPAVIADAPISEEPCPQSKSVLGEDLVHESLLSIQRLDRTATWESVIIQAAMY